MKTLQENKTKQENDQVDDSKKLKIIPTVKKGDTAPNRKVLNLNPKTIL